MSQPLIKETKVVKSSRELLALARKYISDEQMQDNFNNIHFKDFLRILTFFHLNMLIESSQPPARFSWSLTGHDGDGNLVQVDYMITTKAHKVTGVAPV